jgi:hypothetical protein
MSIEQAKGCWRGLNPNKQIEVVLRNKLSENKFKIDNNLVHKKLNKKISQL